MRSSPRSGCRRHEPSRTSARHRLHGPRRRHPSPVRAPALGPCGALRPRHQLLHDRVVSWRSRRALTLCGRGSGHVRLVLGIHDVPADLAQAAARQQSDPVGTVVEGVRERIVAGIAIIADEIAIDRLATIAWMMQDGLLEIRVAAPQALPPVLRGSSTTRPSSFGTRTAMSSAAVGSPNETGAGLGQNFEHLTVFSSWEQPRIRGRTGPVLREPLEQSAGWPESSANWTQASQRRSSRPCPRDVGLSDARQRRTRRCARYSTSPQPCRRWRWCPATTQPSTRIRSAPSSTPCRAGRSESSSPTRSASGRPSRRAPSSSTCSSTPQATGLSSLRPRGVVYQWQAELSEHFDLDAWVFDSGRRAMVSPEGEARLLGRDDPVLSPAMPEVTIMSAQYARGTRRARARAGFRDGDA